MNMKKFLTLAVFLAGILASCTNDDITNTGNTPLEKNGIPIEFGGLKAAVTRADVSGKSAADLLGNNFVVEGIKTRADGTSVVFDHYNVNYLDGSANSTTSNTSGWEYVGQPQHEHSSVTAQTIKYWDYSASKYDFVAYSLGTADKTKLTVSAINPNTLGTAAYTIKGAAADLAGVYIADMVTAVKDNNDYSQTVTMRFHSLSAKVRIGLYETVPGYSVKDVKFYTDVKTAATDGNAYLYTTGEGNAFNNSGTYTVYYNTEGRACLNFAADASEGTTNKKSYGALANFVNKELGEAAGNYLGRNTSEATYAGNAAPYYSTVIPNEAGAELTLKVDYTLVSTDGSGEVINVYGASAKVPAAYAKWIAGYAYTYLFKISNNTNGSTSGIDPETGEPLGPAGLYPITFDAVVTESEDGVQETITPVAAPSITTYTKGKVVTENNEYKVNNNIYVVVGTGTALTVGTNAKLYTVTLEAGAAQQLTEQAIDNALAHGTYDSTAKTYTVTDANGKKLIVTENDGLSAISAIPAADSPTGTDITVNGAKFTPSTAGTYVFQYMTAAAAGAVYSGPTTYGVGFVLDPDKSYFKKVGDDYVPYTNSVGDGSELYILTTPASPAKYIYKIIVVN